MNTAKKLTIVILLTCLICDGISFCKESEKTKPQLNFKISTDIYKIPGNSPSRRQDHFGHMEAMMGMGGFGEPGMNQGRYGGGYGGGYGAPGGYSATALRDLQEEKGETESTKSAKETIIKPTHVTNIEGLSNYLFAPECYKPDAILDTPSGKKMSDLQIEFVKQGNACKIKYNRFVGSPIKFYYLMKAKLFAVTQEDAKKMASAFIESWEIHKGDEISRCKKGIKDFENQAAKSKKLFEDTQKKYDELKKKLIEKTSTNLYSPDDIVRGNKTGIEESRQTAKQLKSQLSMANIEIEVIKAKLSAATVYQARNQTSKDANPKVLAKLEEIICEHTIELAGALEKQKRVNKLFQEENEFYNLFTQFDKTGLLLEKCNREANRAEGNLKKAIEKFELMDLSYPKVKENTAIIRPVEF